MKLFEFLDKVFSKLPFNGAKTYLSIALGVASQVPALAAIPQVQLALQVASVLGVSIGATHKVVKAKVAKNNNS